MLLLFIIILSFLVLLNKIYTATLLVFQDSRLEEGEFKGWSRKVKVDKTKYCCIVCNKKLFYLLQEDVL